MKKMVRRLFTITLVVLVTLSSSMSMAAGSYPIKSVQIIVGFSAGGAWIVLPGSLLTS